MSYDRRGPGPHARPSHTCYGKGCCTPREDRINLARLHRAIAVRRRRRGPRGGIVFELGLTACGFAAWPRRAIFLVVHNGGAAGEVLFAKR